MQTTPSIQAQKEAFARNPKKFIADHMANRHMWEAHEETHPAKMLNNILKPGHTGGKFADTQFRRGQNMDIGEDCVKKLLIQHFDSIHAYLQQYKADPENTPPSALFPMTFTLNHPDGRKIPDYIGTGYRYARDISSKGRKNGEITSIELVKTNQAGIIVRPAADNPDGWEISSAFPMASPRQTEITAETSIQKVDKDFRHILHKTFTYQDADPIMQAYLNTACSGAQIDERYRTTYSPKTEKRPPIIMIMPDFKHPEFKSEYPRITLYANQEPPANATLFLDKDKKMRLGTEKSLDVLKEKDPVMFDIYNQLISNMPEEFRPNGTYYKRPESSNKKRMFQEDQKPVEKAQPEKQDAQKLQKSTRHDPYFDAVANEIEERSGGPDTSQEYN